MHELIHVQNDQHESWNVWISLYTYGHMHHDRWSRSWSQTSMLILSDLKDITFEFQTDSWHFPTSSISAAALNRTLILQSLCRLHYLFSLFFFCGFVSTRSSFNEPPVLPDELDESVWICSLAALLLKCSMHCSFCVFSVNTPNGGKKWFMTFCCFFVGQCDNAVLCQQTG